MTAKRFPAEMSTECRALQLNIKCCYNSLESDKKYRVFINGQNSMPQQ